MIKSKNDMWTHLKRNSNDSELRLKYEEINEKVNKMSRKVLR